VARQLAYMVKQLSATLVEKPCIKTMPLLQQEKGPPPNSPKTEIEQQKGGKQVGLRFGPKFRFFVGAVHAVKSAEMSKLSNQQIRQA